MFYVFRTFHMSICNVMSQTSMTVVEVVCLHQQCCSLLLWTQEHREPLLMYRTSPINQSLKWFITLCKVAACGLQGIVGHVVNALECCLEADTIKAIHPSIGGGKEVSVLVTCVQLLCVTCCNEWRNSHLPVTSQPDTFPFWRWSHLLSWKWCSFSLFIYVQCVHMFDDIMCNCTTTKLCVVSSVT